MILSKVAEIVKRVCSDDGLRPYQLTMYHDIHNEWDKGHRNVLAVLPTGGGKTRILSAIIRDHDGASCTIAHRQELVSQISLAFARNGVRHRIIGSNKIIRAIVQLHMSEVGTSYYDPNARASVAGVDTIMSWCGTGVDGDVYLEETPSGDKLLYGPRENGNWGRPVKVDLKPHGALTGKRPPKDISDSIRRYTPTVTKWVTDECFTAGTLIDGKRIDEIKQGDEVTAFDENTCRFSKRKVVRLFKNKAPSDMVRVETLAHHVVHCTGGHPFWTNRGWVNASDLKLDDKVLINEMCDVRKGSDKPYKVAKIQTDITRSDILLDNMFKKICVDSFIGNNESNESKTRIETDERKQSNAKRVVSVENESDIKSDRSSTENSRRERSTTYASRKHVKCDVIGHGVQTTNDSENERVGKRRLSTSLQNRLWSFVNENSNRSRRIESSFNYQARTGRTKKSMSYWVGLDSVTVHESSDNEFARDSDHDGFVYNIEVEGLHTYVANGITVHNCHHLGASGGKRNKWMKAVDLFPNALGLGVTATPVRADGAGLGRHHDGVMDVMVIGPTMRWLIDNEHLSEYRIFAPPSDLSGRMGEVKTSSTTGDFNVNQVRNAVEQSNLIVADDKTSKVVGDVVQTYLLKFKGMLSVVFVPSVTAAEELERQFISAGVPAKSLNGNTSDEIRINSIRKFSRRELMVLINVALFDEGTDIPVLEVVQDAYPTQSYGKFVQRFGRMLRLMEGKEYGIYSDHAGNVMRHGLPDAKREWTLDRREKRSTKDDVEQLRTCVDHMIGGVTVREGCFSVYDRYLKECPSCGLHVPTPTPVERTGPEYVDGDLFELDAETLARMRGDIARVDKPMDEAVAEYRNGLINKHVPAIGVMANTKRFAIKHEAQQEAVKAIRDIMAMWAGYHRAANRDDAEIFRRFYLAYGVDWLTAQSLPTDEMLKLGERIAVNIGSVD